MGKEEDEIEGLVVVESVETEAEGLAEKPHTQRSTLSLGSSENRRGPAQNRAIMHFSGSQLTKVKGCSA